MGARKRIKAEQRKEEKKHISYAILRNCPSSPRKMRLVADLVRGQKVDRALDILHFSPKVASRDIEKLLKSAVANWQAKNEGQRLEDVEKIKYKIIQKLRKVEEPEKLYKIEKVLDSEELHPLLVHLLEKSNAEAEKKKGKAHKDVMAEVRQKFPIQKDA